MACNIFLFLSSKRLVLLQHNHFYFSKPFIGFLRIAEIAKCERDIKRIEKEKEWNCTRDLCGEVIYMPDIILRDVQMFSRPVKGLGSNLLIALFYCGNYCINTRLFPIISQSSRILLLLSSRLKS